MLSPATALATHTAPVIKRGRRLTDELLTAPLTVAEGICILTLCLFAMNGRFGLVPGRFLDAASHISIFAFWAVSIGAFLMNRGRIHWELWTCRLTALFLGWMLLSLTWGASPITTTYSPALSSLCVFLYYNYILDRFPPIEFRRLLMWTYSFLFIVSVFLIIFVPWSGKETLLSDGNPDNVGAWIGVFRQKNELGLNCAIAYALCIGQAPRTSTERVWRALLLILTLGLAVGSSSREAWVAIIVVTLLSVLVKFVKRLAPASRVPFCLISIITLVLGTYLVYDNLDYILGLFGRTRNLTGRADLWEWSMLIAAKRPWLGYGMYGVWHTPRAWPVIARAGWQVTSSHNTYLDTVIDYGIIGLVLYLPIPVSAVLYAFRAIVSYSLEQFEIYIYFLTVVIVMSFAGGFMTLAPGISFVLVIYTVSNLEQVERSGFMHFQRGGLHA
jgi:exopolysaccharide production protein ExoQ